MCARRGLRGNRSAELHSTWLQTEIIFQLEWSNNKSKPVGLCCLYHILHKTHSLSYKTPVPPSIQIFSSFPTTNTTQCFFIWKAKLHAWLGKLTASWLIFPTCIPHVLNTQSQANKTWRCASSVATLSPVRVLASAPTLRHWVQSSTFYMYRVRGAPQRCIWKSNWNIVQKNTDHMCTRLEALKTFLEDPAVH